MRAARAASAARAAGAAAGVPRRWAAARRQSAWPRCRSAARVHASSISRPPVDRSFFRHIINYRTRYALRHIRYVYPLIPSLYIITAYTCSARRRRAGRLCSFGAIELMPLAPQPLLCLCHVTAAAFQKHLSQFGLHFPDVPAFTTGACFLLLRNMSARASTFRSGARLLNVVRRGCG